MGKSLLNLNFLGCVESESLCQADVVLKKTLDIKRTYEFQLQVKDTTGDYTKVHATITSTMGTSNFNPLFGPRIIHLAEVSYLEDMQLHAFIYGGQLNFDKEKCSFC